MTDVWALCPDAAELNALALDDIGKPPPTPYLAGRTWIVPVKGVLARGPSLLTRALGWSDYLTILAQVREGLAEERAASIVLQVDSVGGDTSGLMTALDELLAARQEKNIAAYVDEQALSAGYALAAIGQPILLASPTATAGSIGVMAARRDRSTLDPAQHGLTHVLASGKRKRDLHPDVALSSEGRAAIQRLVDDTAAELFAAIAKARPGLSVDRQRALEAAFLTGSAAVDAGLADGIVSPTDFARTIAAAAAA